MSAPALGPAAAGLAGVVGGLLLERTGAAIVVFCLLGCCALAAVCLGRGRHGCVTIASIIGIALAGWLVGADAAADRRQVTLPRVLERSIVAGWEPSGRGPVLVEGVLRRDAASTDYGASLDLESVSLHAPAGTTPVSGGVRIGVGGALVAERIEEWRAGRRLRMPVTLRPPPRYWNPGTGDRARSLRRRGVVRLGSVKSALLVEVRRPASAAGEAAAAARAFVRRSIDAAVGPWSARSAGIVVALLIGDRTGLEPDVLERLRAAGTYHVLAISGGNIAILVGLLLLVSRAAGLSPGRGAAMSAVALVLYAWTVGPEPSVVRATIVALVYLAARIADHRTAPLNALAVAGLATALIAPHTVIEIGFTLSFGAAVAIVVGAGRCARWLRGWADRTPARRLPPRLMDAAAALLAATICAELALLPVGAYAFSRVSIAGLGLNFLAIPLMTVAQVAGLACLALAWLLPDVAAVSGIVAHVAAEVLVRSAHLVAVLPLLTTRVPAPPPWLLGLYYTALAAWLAPWSPVGARSLAVLPRHLGRVVVAASVAMMLAGVPVTGGARDGSRPGPPDRWRSTGRPSPGSRPWLEVVALDVGQGDATLARFPDGRTLLVDAGGSIVGAFDVGARVVVPALWALGVRRLDALAITHGDPDHAGGAASVVSDLRPREVWDGVPVPASDRMRALRGLAAATGARWMPVRAGHVRSMGGVEVRILHPPEPDWERPRVRNDDSIVIALRVGEVAVLLTGDIGADVEPDVIAALPPAALWLVKMPHHGSRTSSSAPFVDGLWPVVAFASAGRANRFGHPAPDVVRRYRAAGAAIFRTDRDGAIRIRTDGRTVELTTRTGRYLRLDRRARP